MPFNNRSLLGALLALYVATSPCNAFTRTPPATVPARFLGSAFTLEGSTVPIRILSTSSLSSRTLFRRLQAKRDDRDNEVRKKNQALDNLTTGGGPDFTTFTFAAGILVIVAGFILNSFGYDYVVKDGHVTIGTIEERQFQDELNRVSKQKKEKAAVPVASIESLPPSVDAATPGVVHVNYVSGDTRTSALQLQQSDLERALMLNDKCSARDLA